MLGWPRPSISERGRCCCCFLTHTASSATSPAQARPPAWARRRGTWALTLSSPPPHPVGRVHFPLARHVLLPPPPRPSRVVWPGSLSLCSAEAEWVAPAPKKQAADGRKGKGKKASDDVARAGAANRASVLRGVLYQNASKAATQFFWGALANWLVQRLFGRSRKAGTERQHAHFMDTPVHALRPALRAANVRSLRSGG